MKCLRKEHALKRLAVWLVLGLLVGCSPKGNPTPTLVPTLTLPTATPSPLPPPTETPLPTPTEVPLAARVNGQPIFLADFEREVARAGGVATRQQVLDKMIEMMLLEQAAAAAGITITDEEIDAIVQADIAAEGLEAFAAWLAANDMTEEEYRAETRLELLARRVQEQIPEELPTTVEHVHARHILVATQQEAEAILAQLQDGADFATLAQTFSLDVTTRDRGGDLDFFPRGLLLAPELEEAAFALAPGQISDVVHSELLGYHIVQVLEREERPISDKNQEAIKANQRASTRLWREQLWAEATIERFVEP
jgi:parvulin-like peptidyl-prolyl isomerase